MPLKPEIERSIERFALGEFARCGCLITDLDGTAVHQDGPRVIMPGVVSRGLTRVREAGRPVIVNTLRFPLSIMRTFGRQWIGLTGAPMPVVCLNGSLVGTIRSDGDGAQTFEERMAWPLSTPEVEGVLTGIEDLLAAQVSRLLLFVYPRLWTEGELVWTPDADRADELRKRYVSASSILVMDAADLRAELMGREICMMMLLADDPADRRLAFQHASPSRYFTREGIDKLAGAEHLARALSVDLAVSIGAGDTELDNFLAAVGLALHVGQRKLPFRGRTDTLALSDPFELGAVLHRLAARLEATAAP